MCYCNRGPRSLINSVVAAVLGTHANAHTRTHGQSHHVRTRVATLFRVIVSRPPRPVLAASRVSAAAGPISRLPFPRRRLLRRPRASARARAIPVRCGAAVPVSSALCSPPPPAGSDRRVLRTTRTRIVNRLDGSMISAGRCTAGGVGGGGGGGGGVAGRTAIMSKDCRTVNGGGVGGYVNHCEQALDAKNEMVMAASKIAVATGGDLNATATTATTVNNRFYPLSCSEMGGLKDLALTNIELINDLNVLLMQRDQKITELTKEVEILHKKLTEANQRAERATREESLDVLPFTPVSSTCSSGMGDLSSAELPEQQEVKPKKRRSRQVTLKQPNPDPLEPNQTKRQRTRSTRAKSADIGKMQEVSLITADNAYYTCLGNYDPIKDDPEKSQLSLKKGVLEEDLKNLEIPSWRIKTYSSWYSMEGTENMSDDIFENRHSRLEVWERKRKRWDMQRIRELRRIEYLKEGRNKHHSQNSKKNDKKELTTLLPNPAHIKAIEITENLPVSAFGCNLHIRKKPESFKFYHSQWYNDGSGVEVSQEKNVRGLRSSARGQFIDTI